jgi:hypothetical protein
MRAREGIIACSRWLGEYIVVAAREFDPRVAPPPIPPQSSLDSSSVNFPFQARSRYRQPLQRIRIVEANISEVTLEFEQVQDVLSPGQSLVIYDGEECLGGGVIC